jgi:hypothetical protein
VTPTYNGDDRLLIPHGDVGEYLCGEGNATALATFQYQRVINAAVVFNTPVNHVIDYYRNMILEQRKRYYEEWRHEIHN